MGDFYVTARVTGPTGKSEELRLFVDTGAIFLMLPRAVADRLELRPHRVCAFQTADNREVTWPVADVRLTLNGDETMTPCAIAPDGDAILGAVALESLLLMVDPAGQRLLPRKGRL